MLLQDYKITADGGCSHGIKRRLLLGRKGMTNLDSILKSRDITLPTKVCLVKAMLFPSSRVWMWDLDHKESWAPENWCFWTVVLENTLESPLDCKEIQPVHPKRNQSWIFFGGIDAKAVAPILWPPDAGNQLIGKDPDAGRDWRREEKETTEDEMVGWCHPLNGQEFEQALRVGDQQGSLAFCSPWGCKSWTRLNWTELYWTHICFKIKKMFYILATPCGMWDLCSSIRGLTHVPLHWKRSLNH